MPRRFLLAMVEKGGGTSQNVLHFEN